jgi:hypothetical protein
MEDIWHSQLIQDLFKRGYFSKETDLALGLSADGINAFQKRGIHSIWPIILVNFNLPPQER